MGGRLTERTIDRVMWDRLLGERDGECGCGACNMVGAPCKPRRAFEGDWTGGELVARPKLREGDWTGGGGPSGELVARPKPREGDWAGGGGPSGGLVARPKPREGDWAGGGGPSGGLVARPKPREGDPPLNLLRMAGSIIPGRNAPSNSTLTSPAIHWLLVSACLHSGERSDGASCTRLRCKAPPWGDLELMPSGPSGCTGAFVESFSCARSMTSSNLARVFGVGR